MKAGVVCAAILMSSAALSASVGPPAGIGERAKKAQKIVVAKVVAVESAFGVNDHGDQLILSHVTLQVEETLKGPHLDAMAMTIEGGTVGGLTLKVSDMPVLQRGERAVMFLDGHYNDHVPTDRGNGVLKLDRSNKVDGTAVTLDDVRDIVRSARR